MTDLVRAELAIRDWRPADLERLLGALRAEAERLENSSVAAGLHGGPVACKNAPAS